MAAVERRKISAWRANNKLQSDDDLAFCFTTIPVPLGDGIDLLWNSWCLRLFLLRLLKNEEAALSLDILRVDENRNDHLDVDVWLYGSTKLCAREPAVGTLL